jgi:hypothetical protein
MGRRRHEPKAPQALKDTDFATACGRVNTLMLRYAAATLTLPMTREEIIDAMFSQEVIDKLTAAKPYANYISDRQDYNVAPDVNLSIDFKYGAFRMIPPAQQWFVPGKPEFEPMRQFIEQARDIYFRFSAVKALLRWFNRNATASAIRYYWPPILQVAGDLGPFRELHETPTRYSEPREIGLFLQMLRDTTSMMGMAVLIPDVIVPKSRTAMWLTFGNMKIKTDHYSYQTDLQEFNL